MRVLLVEDDPTTAKSVEILLTQSGITPFWCDLGQDAIDLIKVYDYDIVLLDLNLPDMSGFDVLQNCRTSNINTPIVAFTGSSDIQSKIKFLDLGGDGYINKPYHRDELISWIHTIVRRSNGRSRSVIEIGEISVDLDGKTVRVNGQIIHLTGKEYQIMEILSLRKGMTLTKEMILNHLYGGMDEPELKIIDVFICKLRRKLSAAMKDQSYIETVWGQGYRLNDK